MYQARVSSAGNTLLPEEMVRRKRSRAGRIGPLGGVAVSALLIVAALALVGPRLWSVDPAEQRIDERLQNPSWSHPVGTDRYGRDNLARLLTGARWTLAGAVAVCTGVNIVGFAVGVLSATGSRRTDGVLGRLIEAMMALPGLVTALAFTSVLGPSFRNLLVAMVVTSWPWYARTYRSVLLKERSAPYVEGAVALGAGQLRVILRHVLPNVIGPAVVLATTNLGSVILNLAALSFLGLGIQPPTPEWGAMINDARPYFQRYPWQMIAPGLCIVTVVLCVNLAGDALRDAFDPRLR